jgi:hypothetical protein
MLLLGISIESKQSRGREQGTLEFCQGIFTALNIFSTQQHVINQTTFLLTVYD